MPCIILCFFHFSKLANISSVKKPSNRSFAEARQTLKKKEKANFQLFSYHRDARGLFGVGKGGACFKVKIIGVRVVAMAIAMAKS